MYKKSRFQKRKNVFNYKNISLPNCLVFLSFIQDLRKSKLLYVHCFFHYYLHIYSTEKKKHAVTNKQLVKVMTSVKEVSKETSSVGNNLNNVLTLDISLALYSFLACISVNS